MSDAIAALLTIAAGVIGLATIAVLVSNQAQTSSVISSSSTGFASIIGAAVAPVSGGSTGTAGLNGTGTLGGIGLTGNNGQLL
jgi:hypothetical protein